LAFIAQIYDRKSNGSIGEAARSDACATPDRSVSDSQKLKLNVDAALDGLIFSSNPVESAATPRLNAKVSGGGDEARRLPPRRQPETS